MQDTSKTSPIPSHPTPPQTQALVHRLPVYMPTSTQSTSPLIIFKSNLEASKNKKIILPNLYSCSDQTHACKYCFILKSKVSHCYKQKNYS